MGHDPLARSGLAEDRARLDRGGTSGEAAHQAVVRVGGQVVEGQPVAAETLDQHRGVAPPPGAGGRVTDAMDHDDGPAGLCGGLDLGDLVREITRLGA